MHSSYLFHGPSAQQRALSEANKLGELLAPPFGISGLKVDEAREVVSLLHQGFLSSETVGVVVVGPLDLAQSKSTDALLKTLEEPPGASRLILWAWDVGEVSPTVVSRCLTEFCPGEDTLDDEAAEEAARNLLFAYDQKDWSLLPDPSVLKGPDVARIFVTLLDMKRHFALWESIRPIFQYQHISPLELISAVIEAGHE